MITQERLKELLHYDPETGVFTRKVRTSNDVKVGDIAGSMTADGYIRIRVDGRRYLAHRLAWFHVYGTWPEDQLDHISGVRDDNRISNLREATNTQNCQNHKSPRCNSTSGYLGVSFRKEIGRWHAHITVSGKKIHLGFFNCSTAAYLLGYLPAKRKLHEFGTL